MSFLEQFDQVMSDVMIAHTLDAPEAIRVVAQEAMRLLYLHATDEELRTVAQERLAPRMKMHLDFIVVRLQYTRERAALRCNWHADWQAKYEASEGNPPNTLVDE